MSVHHDRIIGSVLSSMEPGCPVITADQEQVGTLAEVRDEMIKVNAPLRRDFWIKADYVRECEPGRIELSFNKQDLGAYKMANAAPAEDPLVEGKADHIVSPEEQLDTRLRMERELAEQRQQLPHLHPRGEEAPPDTFGTLGESVESELERHGELPSFESHTPRPSVLAGGAADPANRYAPDDVEDYFSDDERGGRGRLLVLVGIMTLVAAAAVLFLRRK